MDRKTALESKYTIFFLNWLNRKYGFDYSLKFNQEVDEVDNFGTSIISPTLNLQLTFARGDFFRVVKGKKLGQVNLVGEIQSAVSHKENRYPKDLKIKTILLIQAVPPTPALVEMPKAETKLKDSINSDFKGIYYVSPPMTVDPATKETKDGFVITIKDGFRFE